MIIALPLPEHDPALEISLRNTSLEVEPSGGGGATARFIPAGEDAPRDTGERFTVRTRESDDGGPPVVCVDEQRLENPEAACKGRLLVQVPEPTRLRLRSRNGGIEAHDLAGQLHLRTRNGAINVRNNRGAVSAGAANGVVHLCAVSGPSVDVSAANGSVSLSDIETPLLRVSTSNGRVRAADARIGGGTVRSANGRIALQISPLAAASDPASDPAPETAAAEQADGGAGRLSVYSANGPVTVALPERINATVKAHTGGVLRNHLGSARSRTDRSVTTLQFGDGEPEMLILIKNLRGGIEVTKHADFESRRTADEGFSDDDARNYGVWFDVDFSEEFPRFMRDMKEFGMKFGRLGEEVSREMRRAFRFGGGGEHRGPRPWHEERPEAPAGAAPDGGSGAEVKTVLDLLKEGKISVEEAERLLAALRQ